MLLSNKLKKKYIVKVPQNINVVYCDKKNMITFLKSSQKRSLKLKVKIFLVHSSNSIVVSSIPVFGNSMIDFKNAKKLQGTTAAKIKQMLVEVTYTLYNKLNLVGVGYRVFPYENLTSQIYFKLGYSHLIYFKLPTSLNSFCQKFTKLFLFGDGSYDILTQTAAQIRNCKCPEPYKGKGILYDQENITLKKGKKI